MVSRGAMSESSTYWDRGQTAWCRVAVSRTENPVRGAEPGWLQNLQGPVGFLLKMLRIPRRQQQSIKPCMGGQRAHEAQGRVGELGLRVRHRLQVQGVGTLCGRKRLVWRHLEAHRPLQHHQHCGFPPYNSHRHLHAACVLTCPGRGGRKADARGSGTWSQKRGFWRPHSISVTEQTQGG